jgi:hypothetical protein
MHAAHASMFATEVHMLYIYCSQNTSALSCCELVLSLCCAVLCHARFPPQSNLLATCGADATVQLFDLGSQRQLTTLTGKKFGREDFGFVCGFPNPFGLTRCCCS